MASATNEITDNEFDDQTWVTELEVALSDDCDFGTLRNICGGRVVPVHLRADVWQICLNVHGKAGVALSAFDGLYDMSEQDQLRSDCAAAVDKLANDESDKLSIISDLESIVTFYCKSRNESYSSETGWMDILQPLITFKLSRAQLYNCFYTLVNKYVPRECYQNGKAFHLFRLLLQYHEPELCSFLDTKRITPDLYAGVWFRRLFAGSCDLPILENMWDVYLQSADPFLIFFMSLVILINAKDQTLTMEQETKATIIDTILKYPSALEADDIEDFCALAQYYASRTPQSFRRDYHSALFGSLGVQQLGKEVDSLLPIAQALCLPVSVTELMQATDQAGGDSAVRYFVVDCRPADQYNSGHLPTAFHLDASLMLQNPVEFSSAMDALLSTQKHAVSTGSLAGGEHLCFMGSGRDEEDHIVNMVVASFLQKYQLYVSLARGGYAALHRCVEQNLSRGLSDHNSHSCIVCNPDATPTSASELETLDEHGRSRLSLDTENLLNKLSVVMKSKSAIMKDKLTNYIRNEHNPVERHISGGNTSGKSYRNTGNIFSIAADDEDSEEMGSVQSEDEDKRELVKIDTWLSKPDVIYTCQCQHIKHTGGVYPSYLLLMANHLYALRELSHQKGMAAIVSRRPLCSIVKITSKKRHPELITFKYGTNDEDGLHITDQDSFLISKAGEAVKAIKYQIISLENMDS